MASTEIEKLERRYAENPQGLTFAPLAEVHRKNGEVARALELLRAGLELHPNYIPASIVLGRCHWDLSDLPAAEAAFSHVLRLDDENVIALKSLADINERLERWGDAQRWLNRLISVDRSNEEARQQLARIEAAKQKPSSSPVISPETAAVEAPPKPEPAPEIAKVAAEARPDLATEREPKPEPRAAAPPMDLMAVSAEPEPLPLPEPPREAAEPKGPVLQFLDTSEPEAQTPEEPAPLPGLVSQEFVPPSKEATYHLHPELTQEFVSDSRVSSDKLEVETAEEVELQSSGASEFRVPNAAEEFMDVAAAPPPSAEPLAPAPAAEPARRSYSVGETRGQSVATFFQALLSARPPGSPSTAATTLDGAEASRSSQEVVTQQSVLTEDVVPSSPAVAASSTSQDAAVSFDDFFGASTPGSSPLPKGNADPSKDDLDQFQSWLQNLKR